LIDSFGGGLVGWLGA